MPCFNGEAILTLCREIYIIQIIVGYIWRVAMIREKGIWYQNMDREKWIEKYPQCSMFEQLKNSSQNFPDYPAIDFQNKCLTFRQVLEKSEQLAKALISIGIRRGDIVSIISPNAPQGVLMVYALNRIGAVANMIHPLLSRSEIQHSVEETESVAVLIMDVIYEKISRIKWEMENPPQIIIAKVIDALPIYMKPLFQLKTKKKMELNDQHNNIYWNDLLKLGVNRNASLPSDSGSPEAVAVILYSGGTTGIPKGVMLTNYNLTCYAIQAFEASGMDTIGKRCLGVLPLFHGFGLALCVHTMLCAGTCVYLVPTYDFKKCNALIFRKKLNFLCGVPAFFESLSRYPDMESKDLSFIECLISGGDVLPVRLQKRINKQLKAGGSSASIREAYGQTESVTGCCINPEFHNVMGSVGIPCPDIESKVVEPGTIKGVAAGIDGELCLTGPNIMKGYYKNPEATNKILRQHEDGRIWLHTGDIFYKNEEGFLFFRQRMARMVVCSGYNVYLSQIERVVNNCSIVSESCAVSIEDRVVGSKIGLFIILNTSIEQVEAQELIMKFCRENMANYSLPHRIFFVEEFPRTKMGKVDYLKMENSINERG